MSELYKFVCLSSVSYISSENIQQSILLGSNFNDVLENLCRKALNSKGYVSIPKYTKSFPAVYPKCSIDRIFQHSDIKIIKAFVRHTDLARETFDHLPMTVDFALI